MGSQNTSPPSSQAHTGKGRSTTPESISPTSPNPPSQDPNKRSLHNGEKSKKGEKQSSRKDPEPQKPSHDDHPRYGHDDERSIYDGREHEAEDPPEEVVGLSKKYTEAQGQDLEDDTPEKPRDNTGNTGQDAATNEGASRLQQQRHALEASKRRSSAQNQNLAERSPASQRRAENEGVRTLGLSLSEPSMGPPTPQLRDVSPNWFNTRTESAQLPLMPPKAKKVTVTRTPPHERTGIAAEKASRAAALEVFDHLHPAFRPAPPSQDNPNVNAANPHSQDDATQTSDHTRAAPAAAPAAAPQQAPQPQEASLSNLTWPHLFSRFDAEMAEKQREEEQATRDFEKLLKVHRR